MDTTGPAREGVARSLLLLAVDERARYRTRGDVRLAVAAGSLADDVLAGTDPHTHGTDPRSTDPHGTDPHATAGAVERRLVEGSSAAFDATADAARSDGAVAAHEHRVLGLFPRRGLVVTDAAALARVEQRLLDALRPGRDVAAVAPADAVLAALASVSGLARHHVRLGTEAERTAYRDHLQALSTATGPELAAVVVALRRAYRRLGTGGDDAAVPVFVTADDHDGYGDAGGAGDSSGGSDAGGGDGGGGGD